MPGGRLAPGDAGYKKASALAVRHVLSPKEMGAVAGAVVKEGARALGRIAEEAAGTIAGDTVKKMAGRFRSHFTDQSERLTEALARANERAWKTLEIGLGGQRFWDRFASDNPDLRRLLPGRVPKTL